MIENQKPTETTHDETAEIERKSGLQKVLDIPIIGGFIALIIGLMLPTVVMLFVFPGDVVDETQKVYQNFFIMFLIFIWNAVLFFIFRINITTPLIPIPLFIVGLLGMIYQIYRYFTL